MGGEGAAGKGDARLEVGGEEDAELGGVVREEEAAVFGGGEADGGGVDVFHVLEGCAVGFSSHAVTGLASGWAGLRVGFLYVVEDMVGYFFELVVIGGNWVGFFEGWFWEGRGG